METPKPDVEIELLPGAIDTVDDFLSKHHGSVANLVDSFETPYGTELLASVHWLALHDGQAVDQKRAISAMAEWNESKNCSSQSILRAISINDGDFFNVNEGKTISE